METKLVSVSNRRPMRVFLIVLLCVFSIYILGHLLHRVQPSLKVMTFWEKEAATEPVEVISTTEKPAFQPSRINRLNVNSVERVVDNTRCVELKMIPGGQPICIDTKDKFIGPAIVGTGAWDRHVWNPMLKLISLDPELGLIDLGANIGVFTISVAALGRRVVAVEAFYENIQRMSESLRMGGLADKVTVINNAVSNVYEDVYFWRPDDNPGGTITLSAGVTLAPDKPIYQGDHNTVATIYLDDLVEVIPFKKAIMKSDVDGSEGKAFKKMETLLDKIDIVALFMEWTIVKGSDDCVSIVKLLTRKGYEPNSLDFEPLRGSSREELVKWPSDMVWLKKTYEESMINTRENPGNTDEASTTMRPIPGLVDVKPPTVEPPPEKLPTLSSRLATTPAQSAEPSTTVKPAQQAPLIEQPELTFNGNHFKI